MKDTKIFFKNSLDWLDKQLINAFLTSSQSNLENIQQSDPQFLGWGAFTTRVNGEPASASIVSFN